MNDKTMKICVVCGDKAIANNFGALTCMSCKPFFRRNANKVFICKSDGNCLINLNTRKKCRKCRLDKCFAVGMKKEMILNDVDKHFRRSLVEVNRKIKQRVLEVIFNNTETSPSELDLNCEFSEISWENDISKDNPKEVIHNDIELDTNSSVCSDISVSDESSSNSYEGGHFLDKNLSIVGHITNYNNSFTEVEEFKLSELFRVFQPVVNIWNKNYILFDIKDISDLVKTGNYFYEKEINNFIKAIKEFCVFDDICENDRIALVKYSCMDILSLRAIQCYDINKDSWIISVDGDHALSLGLQLLKTLKCNIYLTYKSHFNDIIRECDSDTIILDLLTAIALFNPNRPNLIDRDIVSVQQHLYMHLLQRYLAFKYPTKSESETKSTKLLNTLVNAHILGELEKKYLIGDYQEHYGPLIKEIFDL